MNPATDYDLGLVREVFREEVNGLAIYATLTRWGGLAVFVNLANDAGGFPLWQGDNILEARDWAESREADDRRQLAEQFGA